jgi:hypothetical protein
MQEMTARKLFQQPVLSFRGAADDRMRVYQLSEKSHCCHSEEPQATRNLLFSCIPRLARPKRESNPEPHPQHKRCHSTTPAVLYKDAERTDDLIRNWLRNHNTIEFLGIGVQLNNPCFKPVEFDGFSRLLKNPIAVIPNEVRNLLFSWFFSNQQTPRHAGNDSKKTFSAPVKTNRILAEETSCGGIAVSGAIVQRVGSGVGLA